MSWLDNLKNKRDKTNGSGKERLGTATGNKHLQREGKTDQAKSNLKQTVIL